MAGNISIGMCGASSGGTLNDAKMVKLSRRMNRANVGPGTGRGVVVLKSFVKCASFHNDSDTFAAEAAANFEVPWVMVEAGLLLIVDRTVSMVFAVRYVPP
jgi:hypothetical protein